MHMSIYVCMAVSVENQTGKTDNICINIIAGRSKTIVYRNTKNCLFPSNDRKGSPV
jgi:hypothetical protein